MMIFQNPVNKNDYLGEYTGELISHREADKRGKIYDRANSSFLFDLNDQVCRIFYSFLLSCAALVLFSIEISFLVLLFYYIFVTFVNLVFSVNFLSRQAKL